MGRPTVDIIVPVYNTGSVIERCVESIVSQLGIRETHYNIILVDDGSDSETCAHLNKLQELYNVSVVRHSSNRGRSAAINTGVSKGSSDTVIILDADCIWASKIVFNSFLSKVLDDGYEICFGLTSATGQGFWQRLNAEVCKKRAKGEISRQTTANFAITRSSLEKAGKFSEDYKGYGFEDKDLIARLSKMGLKYCVNPSCLAYHDVSSTDIYIVSKKYFEAGRITAQKFNEKHPEAYRKTMYSLFDSEHRSIVTKVILDILVLGLPLLMASTSYSLKSNVIPFLVKKCFVNATLILSFYKGTKSRQSLD
ncbi:glycosyltransferase family 2 protein [Hahella sp. HN01]|uniref:glycosyltransferase family 2 protein n=1 Tax=Hahella sp. HN01 TaxID=2847262 RepID=UPI001C1EB6EC|nr:glycosyltransferase family A protein [Hahella sp. HN01]MBU6949951.1 glycosyltransferase family 2 protein [Hahella sp. HN01]